MKPLINHMTYLCLLCLLTGSAVLLHAAEALAVPSSTFAFVTSSRSSSSSFHCSSLTLTTSSSSLKSCEGRRYNDNNNWQLHSTATPINESTTDGSSAIVDSTKTPSISISDGAPTSSTSTDNPNPTEEADSDDDPFTLLSTLAAITLLQSDRRRDAIGKETGAQASSATNWIDEGSAFALRKALDKLQLYLPGDTTTSTIHAKKNNGRERQDEAITWLRWMRSIPRPIVVNLSLEARMAANETVSDDFLRLLNTAGSSSSSTTTESGNTTTTTTTKTIGPKKMQQLRKEFLNRLQCQLVLLPSGQGLNGGLYEPAGSLTFGKLLYGGVTRFRLLPSSSGGGRNDNNDSRTPVRPPRRAGERAERKTSKSQHIPSWVQYGGAERRYEAADMGPAMVLELSLLPKIKGGAAGMNGESNNDDVDAQTMQKLVRGDMVLQRLGWSPQHMFRYVANDDDLKQTVASGDDSGDNSPFDLNTPMTLQGKDRNDAFASGFRSKVGGLGPQIDSIVRRVLDGRVIRPAEVDSSGNLLAYKEAKESMTVGDEDDKSVNDGLSLDDTSKQLSMATLEAEELALLGLTPVKGLLLYGPPGCGKTALAREIARALRARAPKIVSAPELLDRWVGGSERLVRELFHDAEAELASVNGDASRSALHVIVIDEIDAVFRKRSAAEDSGEATRSSTVNQILAKLDGVEAIPNVLLIGMTNRRELLDEALLRPGRLEVQIEIPLPDSKGRREILQIHFEALRNRGRLSRPLCSAIDGTFNSDLEGSVDTTTMLDGTNATKGRKRRALKKTTNDIIDYLSPRKKAVYDLADDSVTSGFSGADLEGLVRCAGSIALSRARKEGAGVEALLITLDDVKQGLVEVKA